MHHAKLVAITTPIIPELMGSPDAFVAYVARVSNPANQLNIETGAKLVQSLARNSHWSPFEMAHIVVEVVTTRAIAHQIIRHRSFTFQEFSQRYATVQQEFVISDARLQDNKNRQNSIETNDSATKMWWRSAQEELSQRVHEIYQCALNSGIAKEVARNVLPEGMTPSTLYMAGSVRSFIHYCQLRCANGTQKEHMLVAQSVREILITHFPSVKDIL
jgi:thymidylate synthase (FAD)